MNYNLNAKPKNHKTARRNIGEYICDLGLGKDFLNRSPKS